MKILLVGLGNPILGDDAVGWRVVEQVAPGLDELAGVGHKIEVASLSVGGLRLMEHLLDFDYVIIVDAITTGKSAPGTVQVQALEEIPDLSAGHTTSVHDTSLHNALRFARQMGLAAPRQVDVVGIEARVINEFSEELTPEVAGAIPQAAAMVRHLLTRRLAQPLA